MRSKKDKTLSESLKRKVMAAFLLACLAIVLALGITFYSFSGLKSTVESLTTPNEKLIALNHLYQKITQLDQLQRAEAIRNPGKPYASLLRESKNVIKTLDSLRRFDWGDSLQIERLNEMENTLHQRDKLLLSYLRMKSEFVFNKSFTKQLDSLAGIISVSQVSQDTSVTTTEHRTVTTTYVTPDKAADERNWLNRVFGKKKEAGADQVRIEVQEEVLVKIDTVATTQQDSAIAEVGRLMKGIEVDHVQQNKTMLQRELQLIDNNRNLISGLIKNLREVEQEEALIDSRNNDEAALLVKNAIQRIGMVMIVFFLGAALLAFLIVMDITKSNVLRKQLIQARDEAENLGQVKQRFLANMSHEIRTPLQSIVGFSEQLKDSNVNAHEAIVAIQSSSEHLLHIVNEVLDFSKIESGKLVIERTVFSVNKLVNEVADAIRIQASRKQLTFLLTLPPAHDVVVGDPFRLRQILFNLLGNAVKFTDQGFVKLTIEVDDRGYTVYYKFSIEDTGIGMNEQEMPLVFQQFEQASASINRQFGGTGLGLTIVKKLVEAQHGTLHLESKEGVGSTFTINLHYDKVPTDRLKEVKQIDIQAATDFNGKVLVVDDDETILRLCDVILSKHNIDHTTYNSPLRVLESPITDTIKLIFLDIRMPGMSGIELCRALRTKVDAGVRIVAFTAHVLPEERADLLQAGFDQILTKPFKEAQFMEQLAMAKQGTKYEVKESTMYEVKESTMYEVRSTREEGRKEEEGTREEVSGTRKEERKEEKSNKEKVDVEVFDLTQLQQMTMGDDALMQSILEQFLEDTKANVEQLMNLLLLQDAAGLREVVHQLAGRIGQLGASDLSTELKRLEQAMDRSVPLPDLQNGIEQGARRVEKIIVQVEATLYKMYSAASQ